jgi:aminomethyltransferase
MTTETTELKYTALYPQHEALGAKIVPFGGYAMPVSYPTGQIAEHNAVRTNVGMFDVGHMGVLQLDPNHLKEDVLMVPHEEMPTYRIRYNRLINDQDGVVDDILV